MKARANVSIDKDLLDSARRYNIVLSSFIEEALRKRLSEEDEMKWVADNKKALDAYNNHVDEFGVFSDGVRSF